MPLIFRTTKGSPLTFADGDNNLKYLESGSVQNLVYVTASNSILAQRFNGTGHQVQVSLSDASVLYAKTSSYVHPLTQQVKINGGLELTGSLLVQGDITAINLHVINVTSSNEFASGSTTWGDQLTDNHYITGSLNTTGSVTHDGFLSFNNWALMEFESDEAAGLGGVPLGGIYKSGNFLLIRIE